MRVKEKENKEKESNRNKWRSKEWTKDMLQEETKGDNIQKEWNEQRNRNCEDENVSNEGEIQNEREEKRDGDWINENKKRKDNKERK